MEEEAYVPQAMNLRDLTNLVWIRISQFVSRASKSENAGQVE